MKLKIKNTNSQKRNVLLIITDQQRYDAVGYNSKFVKTPNLDKLSKKSIVCSNAYVQSPQCQPSRASIFTGRYPTAHRVWWNSIDLPHTEKTIGHILSDDGYNTAFFGKAHFSNQDKRNIKNYGFQHDFLFSDWITLQSKKYVKIKKKMQLPKDEYYNCMGDKRWIGKLTDRDLHHEDIITNKAIDWITSSNDPKLCVVSYIGPHPPYAAPPPFSELYDKKDMEVPKTKSYAYSGHCLTDDDWRELKSQYYGMVSWIDDNVGKLLSAVKDNTIVIFMSDHGDILGDHGHFSKGLFAYDGNVKIPLMIYNNEIQPCKYDHIVQSIDVLPTLLHMLKIVRPKSLQGNILTSGFKSNSKINDYALSMIGYRDRLRMIRDDKYKYWIIGQEEKLFDLQSDPGENVNIRNGRILSQMRKKLLSALISAEDTIPIPHSHR